MQSWLIWKDPDAGKDWGQEEKGMTEDELVGWHHWLNGHGCGWTPGAGDGQGGLGCCSPRGHKESDTPEQLNWTEWICDKGKVSANEIWKLQNDEYFLILMLLLQEKQAKNYTERQLAVIAVILNYLPQPSFSLQILKTLRLFHTLFSICEMQKDSSYLQILRSFLDHLKLIQSHAVSTPWLYIVYKLLTSQSNVNLILKN